MRTRACQFTCAINVLIEQSYPVQMLIRMHMARPLHTRTTPQSHRQSQNWSLAYIMPKKQSAYLIGAVGIHGHGCILDAVARGGVAPDLGPHCAEAVGALAVLLPVPVPPAAVPRIVGACALHAYTASALCEPVSKKPDEKVGAELKAMLCNSIWFIAKLDQSTTTLRACRAAQR